MEWAAKRYSTSLKASKHLSSKKKLSKYHLVCYAKRSNIVELKKCFTTMLERVAGALMFLESNAVA